MAEDDLLRGLNDEQRRAVSVTSGPLLVYAGPGTGKTRVVTRRIANQVVHDVDPARILAVTFTDKAAGEMLARLRGMGVPAAGRGGVRASTFHSAALRQVGYFWPRVHDGSGLDVLPSKLSILAPLARRAGGMLATLAPADLAAEVEWVKAQGARIADSDREGRLASLALDGDAPRWVLEADAYRSALQRHDGPWPEELADDEAVRLFTRLFDRYEEVKADAARMDFEDMLAVARGLLVTEPEVAEMVRGQYTHFTVDEFQDVNRLQWDLLTAWLGARDDICVVGDDDQAIYGFSGASPRFLDAFRDRHPDASVVHLVTNYRSTQPLLDLASKALWKRGDRKTLKADAGEGPQARLVQRADEDAERDWVVERCRVLHEQGIEWQQMAVLYRFNAQSEAWEEVFAKARIPFEVRGDQSFFERRHVRQALTVLRTAEQAGEGEASTDDPRVVLDGAVPQRPTIDRLVPRLLRERMSWTERAPEGERARERWQDLQVLVELAEELHEDDPEVTLTDLLTDLQRRADLGHAPDGGGVNLMTLHRAKGLEFDAVFVVSCEEGRVPSRYAVEHDERVGLDVGDPESSVTEESRLLYVGLTRARRHLHVTWVKRGSKRPSRFLYDIGPGAPSSKREVADDRPATRTGDDDGPLDPGETLIFDALREWRLETAMDGGVPAYVVFPDSTLRSIARRRPSTRGELFAIKGVGRTKLKRYGDDVLSLVDDLRADADRTLAAG
ncbi:MAG: ATP-dependent DNA helicase UvrD2 [Actinobacteria bacterium]|nr:ATP-dependent DNA helicase UvrD2 [Actinomycetota bacterium]